MAKRKPAKNPATPTAKRKKPPPRRPSIEQLIAECEQSEKARSDAIKKTLRTEIIPRLKQWGVAKVHAEYSGYGDDGAINHIDYLDGNDQPVNMAVVRAASDPEIERVLYEFLPAGFEVGEGGQGDVYLDVLAGTVTLEHEENFTETRSNTEQWEV